MDTGWIEAVMRLNGAIIEEESRFNAQVIKLVETSNHGQDTTEAEGLLREHKRKLVLLRALQAQLLQERRDEE